MDTYASVPVGMLAFDPMNPRIPPAVTATDDQAVLDWMLEDAGLLELMGSIAVNGFFPAEPLLVMPSAAERYWVLEGNRRLAAVRLLLEPQRAPRRRLAVQAMADEIVDRSLLQQLPCAIFLERAEVLDYLGFRHITGIKQWEPVAKARYLRALYDEHLPSAGAGVYKQIARIIGSRADYVSRLLGALRMHERVVNDPALKRQGLLDGDISFSLLTLALNYSAIVSFLRLPSLDQEAFSELDPDALRDLAVWLYVVQPTLGRTQLGDSRNMKLLATAVTESEGLAALKRGDTVEEAAAATLDVAELFVRSLRQARDRLVTAQGLLHRTRVSDSTLAILDDVEDLAGQLQLLARRKYKRDERADV